MTSTDKTNTETNPPAANSAEHPDKRERWTEIELLPAWDEDYYDVYTAKKYGKWVMLKTLKPQYRDDPKFRELIEKEFEVRYNLSHPSIVMINDFEEVPGIGMCIITDDVFGDSLRKLIDENKVTDKHIEQLKTRLLSAMEYIQHNHIAHHPIRPETIIFTEKIGNLKLIDVGFEQKKWLSHEDTNNDIENFGNIILEILEKTGRHEPELKKVAERCVGLNVKPPYRDVQALKLAVSGRSNTRFYVVIAVLLAALVGLLAWMLAQGNA